MWGSSFFLLGVHARACDITDGIGFALTGVESLLHRLQREKERRVRDRRNSFHQPRSSAQGHLHSEPTTPRGDSRGDCDPPTPSSHSPTNTTAEKCSKSCYGWGNGLWRGVLVYLAT